MKKLYHNIDAILSRRTPNEIRKTVFLLTLIVSVAVYLAGYEISTSLFFLIPVSMATWYGTHRLGVYYAFLSVSVWFLIDTSVFAHSYNHPLIPYWNTGVRLGLFLITAQFLTLLKAQSNLEKNLSRTDILTGLMNTRGFAEAAERIFELAARHGRPTCLAYIDLDDFKQVNDLRGHSEGDRVLQVVGEVLSGSVRKTELAGRLGGDEFVIALPETDEAGAQALFGKIRNNLVNAMQDHGWPVGFSIGVISFDTPPADFDAALRLADALMYRVKNSGKNNTLFEHYPPDQKTPAAASH